MTNVAFADDEIGRQDVQLRVEQRVGSVDDAVFRPENLSQTYCIGRRRSATVDGVRRLAAAADIRTQLT